MTEEGEECELQQLVPPDDDPRLASKSGEVTPPVTVGVNKTTPTSPCSNKVSSSTGSVRGPMSQGSAGSRTVSRMATGATHGHSSTVISPSGGSGASVNHNTRFLYINERSSRGASRNHPVAARLHNTKKDVTDVRRMEAALLHLLEDFHSGKLRAFGKDCSMEQMTGIREQQERLARLHFDLGAQQELYAPLSEEGLRAGQENMHRLMESLEQLSVSIERLHSFSSESRESSMLQD